METSYTTNDSIGYSYLGRHLSTGRPRRKGRRSQFLGGERRAVVTAFTGARLYLDGEVPTLRAAAQAVGTTNISYIKAVLVLLQAEAHDVIEHVIEGGEPLLAAAAEHKKLAKALAAYREIDRFDTRREFLNRTGLYADLASHLINSTPTMRVVAARAAGVDVIWDSMIAPLVGNNGKAVE